MKLERFVEKKIKQDFPDLGSDGIELVKDILASFSKLNYKVNNEEPSEEKAKVLIAQIISFLGVSKL